MKKFISLYLPQFHRLEVNDTNFHPGFTEWHTVAKAKPLFKGHEQPMLPGELGWYNLLDPVVLKNQDMLMRKYGLYGVAMWDYYFDACNTPMSDIKSLWLEHCETPLAFAWANHSWYRKTWNKRDDKTLLFKQKGIDEIGIDYIRSNLGIFSNNKYIRIDGKPLLIIYDGLLFDKESSINNFRESFRAIVGEEVYLVGRDMAYRNYERLLSVGFDAVVNDNILNIHSSLNIIQKLVLALGRKLGRPSIFNYRNASKYFLKDNKREPNDIPMIAPCWDHTPRSSRNGFVLKKATPAHWEEVVSYAVSCMNLGKAPFTLIKSWNEWGELCPPISFIWRCKLCWLHQN